MKNSIIIFILLLTGVLIPGQSSAQEVFFRDPNQELKTVTPDFYYRMRSGDNPLVDYMNQSPARSLILNRSTDIVAAADRWYKTSQASNFRSETIGGIRLPSSITDSLRHNRAINMCFWLKYNDVVYDGNKEGAILDISISDNSTPSGFIAIKNKKLFINSGGKTIAVMDFPIDFGGNRPAPETNGHIFIAITSTWSAEEGNRTRVYMGLPGGHLYCRYFYFSLFYQLEHPGYQVFIGKKISGRVIENPIAWSDLMVFTSGWRATHMMEPDDVLNLFYLQSPLYEGVSYRFASANGVMGMEDRRNNGAPLTPGYLTIQPLAQGSSISPFGFDKFCVEKVDGAPYENRVIIRSMANGGTFAVWNEYAYTNFENNSYVQTYQRGTNPHANYSVDDPSFGFQNETAPLRGRFMTTHGSSPPYVAYPPQTIPASRYFLQIRTANRVFRGPERLISHAQVNLKVYGRPQGNPTGDVVTHTGNYHNWDYVTTTQRSSFNSGTFQLYVQGRKPYIWNTFEGIPGSYSLSRYWGHADITDNTEMITNNPRDCNFEFQFVKNDVNGKPQYLFRTTNHNVGFKLGILGINDPASKVFMRFDGAMNSDGSVPLRSLWSVCKVSGGQTLTIAEKAKLEKDNQTSQQNINKKFLTSLSKTDWPDAPDEP